MNPKRKKIYIAITCVCFSLSIGIVLWSQFFSVPAGVPHDLPFANGLTPSAGVATGDVATGFTAPDVFPVTDVFNTDVLNSLYYNQLKPFDPILIEGGAVGRPNPFNSY